MLEFDNMPDAFDFCRECNHPVHVIVRGNIWKLFPSGKANVIRSSMSRPVDYLTKTKKQEQSPA